MKNNLSLKIKAILLLSFFAASFAFAGTVCDPEIAKMTADATKLLKSKDTSSAAEFDSKIQQMKKSVLQELKKQQLMVAANWDVSHMRLMATSSGELQIISDFNIIKFGPDGAITVVQENHAGVAMAVAKAYGEHAPLSRPRLKDELSILLPNYNGEDVTESSFIGGKGQADASLSFSFKSKDGSTVPVQIKTGVGTAIFGEGKGVRICNKAIGAAASTNSLPASK